LRHATKTRNCRFSKLRQRFAAISRILSRAQGLRGRADHVHSASPCRREASRLPGPNRRCRGSIAGSRGRGDASNRFAGRRQPAASANSSPACTNGTPIPSNPRCRRGEPERREDRRGPRPLGHVTAAECETLLRFQRHLRATSRRPAPALGNLLVSEGFLSKEDPTVLETHRTSGRMLGQDLVAAGHLSPATVEQALTCRRELVGAALAAALASPRRASWSLHAAQAASQTVRFIIKVPPMVRLGVLRPAGHRVTERTSPAMSKSTQRRYCRCAGNTTRDSAPHGPFRAATVTGLAGEVRIGPDGGSRPSLMASRQPASYELSYRFELSPGVTPGSYPWPRRLDNAI
jgi:hypothetical protein